MSPTSPSDVVVAGGRSAVAVTAHHGPDTLVVDAAESPIRYRRRVATLDQTCRDCLRVARDRLVRRAPVEDGLRRRRAWVYTALVDDCSDTGAGGAL
jgi:hypothetical protein